MRRVLVVLALLLAAVPALAQVGGRGLQWPLGGIGTTGARQSLFAYPTINARDAAYGMVCDGATDDAAHLQAALNAAATLGANVFISGSTTGEVATCLMSTNVAPPAGVSLFAVPNTVILKPTAGNAATPVLFSIANSSNIRVDGITFDGGGQDFGTVNPVTQVYGGGTPVDNVVFTRVRFQHTRGIAANWSSNITNSGIRDSYFTDIGNHWKTTKLTADRQQAFALCCGSVQQNYGNFSINNTFSDIGLDPISPSNQHDFLASGNICHLADGQVYATWNNPQPVAMAACIYASNGDLVTIANNIIEAPQGNGVDVIGTNQNAVITGNDIRNAGQVGIGFFGNDATITGNHVRNSTQWSPDASNGSAGIRFAGNAQGRITLSGNISTDDQSSISTTCSGTVAVGATSCTMASIANMSVQGQIKITGAAAAGADLTVYVTGVNGSVVSWNTATSTQVTNPAVHGVTIQAYGIYAPAGFAPADLRIDETNIFSGNGTGIVGGTGQIYGPGVGPVAFANLPSCTASIGGFHAPINNSTTAVFNATITGGGANYVEAECLNGSWVVH